MLLHLIEEKQLFKIKSKTATKTYYVCYQKNCPSRIELTQTGLCYKPKNNNHREHNHGTQEDLIKEIKCVDALRQDCLTSAGSLNDVHSVSSIRKAFKRAVEK